MYTFVNTVQQRWITNPTSLLQKLSDR